MTGLGTLIDVAIGLIFMYLLLSLLCATLNELISGFLSWRSTNLRRNLEDLLDHQGIQNAILNGPFYEGIRRKDTWLGKLVTPRSDPGPAYMSARSFSTALLGYLANGKTDPKQILVEVQSTVGQLPSGRLKTSLQALLTQAGDDYDVLKVGVANWFDDSMDRLSGVYKRHIQGLTLVLAAIITVAANADSITVARTLWNDATLRTALADSAAKYVAEQKPPPAPANVPAESQGGSTTPAPVAAEPDAFKKTLDKFATDFADLQNRLLPFPLGWEGEEKLNPTTAYYLPWKILGLLITILALSLGAPFWFDTLSLFVRLRPTGKKPQRDEVAR